MGKVLGAEEEIEERQQAAVVLVQRLPIGRVASNVRWSYGWLGYIVSSPAFHRWHQGEKPSKNSGSNAISLFHTLSSG